MPRRQSPPTTLAPAPAVPFASSLITLSGTPPDRIISPEDRLHCQVHDRRGRGHRPETHCLGPRRSPMTRRLVTPPTLAQSNLHSIYCIMRTKDQLLYTALQ